MPGMQTARGPDPLNGNSTSIFYDQLAEYRETYDGKIVESVRLLVVDFSQRINLIKAMLATARTDTRDATGETFDLTPYGMATTIQWLGGNNLQVITATRNYMNRLLPEPHPALPFLVATEGQVVEGLGYPSMGTNLNPAAINFFQNVPSAAAQAPEGMAKVMIKYRSLPYATQISDASVNVPGASEITRFVWREAKPTASNLPLQGTYFYEVSLQAADLVNGRGRLIQRIPEPFVKVYPMVKLTYHWIMVPATPPAIFWMMSTLNSTNFDPGSFPVLSNGAPIGNLQYLNTERSEPYFTWHGDQVFDFCHHFVFRQPGFNWRYRPQLGYHRLAIQAHPLSANPAIGITTIPGPANPEPMIAGNGLFNYSDLNNLFKMGTPTNQQLMVL